MTPELSVIIPAHNPRMDYLQSALDSLRAQTLPVSRWELVVVDNRSEPPLAGRLDLAWHPHAVVVREEQLGLTHARLCGFRRSGGGVVVLVDDDNVLAPDYFEHVLKIAGAYPFLGTWGGTITPRYENPDLAPPPSLWPLLTLRSVASDLWSNDCDHHGSTPWGAGLCIRRAVAERYVKELAAAPQRHSLDLQGARLVYGGDTDIAYTGCRVGMGKGVFARLKLEHLIPVSRCLVGYLCRVGEGRGYSEVLHQFLLSGTLPVQRRSRLDWIRALRRRWTMTPLERQVFDAMEKRRHAARVELSVQAGSAKR